jgi:hypothetical protein
MLNQTINGKLNYGAKIATSTSYIKGFVGRVHKIDLRGLGNLTSFVKTVLPSNYSGSYIKILNDF